MVTFEDIHIECDGKECTDEVKWEARVKDDNCDMAAHIVDPKTIRITWNTSATSHYDEHSVQQLYDLNYNGWALRHPEVQQLANLLQKELY